MANPNILSLRYASPEMNVIFSEEGMAQDDRKLWVAVLKAQKELGLEISSDAILKYEAAISDVNLDRIREIELVTRHDLKAKIQAFNEAAGVKGLVHQGMTSRDLTDNVEQMRNKNAATIVFGKYVSMVRHFLDRAQQYDRTVITARTHHQPAQPTLLGRRMSMWAEELLEHLVPFKQFIDNYPLRGIKGPVGTQSDMLKLLGSEEAVNALEQSVAKHLGFSRVLSSPGQVYARSFDQTLLSRLSELSGAAQSYAITMRLMAGGELVTEGFKEGQVGSSAMPHKMNTRSSERINGMGLLLAMYANGAAMNAGNQWEEGDVSCSVVRRIILPDAMYTSDGLCETTLTVLNEMGPYPAVIDAEVDRYLPFLATTQILMEAVQAGIGREEAHAVIKRYAVAAALQMREQGDHDLVGNLVTDPVFAGSGIDRARLDGILANRTAFIGRANGQIGEVVGNATPFLELYAQEAAYEPGSLL